MTLLFTVAASPALSSNQPPGRACRRWPWPRRTLVWTPPVAEAQGRDATSDDCEEGGAPPLLPRPVRWD
jgi:hypothetical protein